MPPVIAWCPSPPREVMVPPMCCRWGWWGWPPPVRWDREGKDTPKWLLWWGLWGEGRSEGGVGKEEWGEAWWGQGYQPDVQPVHSPPPLVSWLSRLVPGRLEVGELEVAAISSSLRSAVSSLSLSPWPTDPMLTPSFPWTWKYQNSNCKVIKRITKKILMLEIIFL